MKRAVLRAALTTTALATALTLGTSALTLPPAATGASSGDPYGTLWDILPPGQSGSVNAVQLAQVAAGDPANRVAVDGKNAPPNFADQLEMYDALTKKRPSALTRTDLDSLYKRENFTPTQVKAEATPKAGVDIKWDQFGVPYIKGATHDDVMFGAGSGPRWKSQPSEVAIQHCSAAGQVIGPAGPLGSIPSSLARPAILTR